MARTEAETRGLDATLSWAHDALGLTYEQIGEILEVSGRTLRRWRRHQHRPRALQQEIIDDLGELRHVLDETFPQPENLIEWLHSSSRLLRGRTPMSFLRAGRVTLLVDALATLEAGEPN
jgi:hypothetical protein